MQVNRKFTKSQASLKINLILSIDINFEINTLVRMKTNVFYTITNIIITKYIIIFIIKSDM